MTGKELSDDREESDKDLKGCRTSLDEARIAPAVPDGSSRRGSLIHLDGVIIVPGYVAEFPITIVLSECLNVINDMSCNKLASGLIQLLGQLLQP